ncbi:SHOCT domain-containing protein [Nocardioides bizhenqiangii]|uniref:SHOCT domain-containing protein n=1 Tax=Nocardioides bizhenqiangii TaxID=3095076 RepID=A0ABZ0ZWD0_9ACTN|nr:SHOCT domain-containing protein [Nocardioides sp. HM61]WQQ28026.1 SHOCT domain-containing protein [Nocardioides sp. HM61]
MSNRVSRRQAGRWAAQEQQYAPQDAQPVPPPAPPAPAAAVDMDAKLAQLKELGELKQTGVLSDDEFEQQKDRILNG